MAMPLRVSAVLVSELARSIYTVAVMPQPSRFTAGPRRALVIASILSLFLLPIAAQAALYAVSGGPRNWRDADWSSIGSLPPARAFPEARILVFSGRTGGWKGVFSVHSWIVFKPKGGSAWTRYDVVGWGNPLRQNGWAPDGRWYGNKPVVVADVSGEDAEQLIPRLAAAIRDYEYRNAGDYRIWPGPNSNTFVASVLRAVPELGAALPPNAVGRDFRPFPYLGASGSRTGIEANLWGILGIKLGWVEGVEVNLFGLVAGFDLRRPALKLPSFGRIGLDSLSPAFATGETSRGEADAGPPRKMRAATDRPSDFQVHPSSSAEP